jgi:hypothetical protein
LLPTPQSNKRPRVATPDKEAQSFDMIARIQEDVEYCKGKIGMAALGVKTDKMVNLGQCFTEFISVTLVSILERNASTMSDLASRVDNLGKENAELKAALADANEELDSVRKSKEKVEVKSSRKDMEDKVRLATTQFKVLDLDLGTNHEDRKTLNEAAKAALKDKVRADLRAEYEAKIKHASIRVLASNTFKRQVNGKDIWTAPVIVTMPEKEERWATENILRKSKVYPAFHWPREMLNNVKVYRNVVTGMGFTETDNYIRIRPEERDGNVKIRADVKPKQGNRFVPVASFDLPPADDKLKSSMEGWAVPSWTSQVAKSMTGTFAAAQTTDQQSVDFTEDEEILNL